MSSRKKPDEFSREMRGKKKERKNNFKKRFNVRTSGPMQENQKKAKHDALSQLRFIHSTFHITNI